MLTKLARVHFRDMSSDFPNINNWSNFSSKKCTEINKGLKNTQNISRKVYSHGKIRPACKKLDRTCG